VSVFAEGHGLFHKGSKGKGVATGDVCLTPAPNGPVPVPYVNTLLAQDLARGSKSVKVDGHETALEATSYVAASSGNADGSHGNVVTRTTRGRGYFKTWSFTIRVEGQGVCRHGDMLGQNSLSTPAGAIAMKALTQFVPPPDALPRVCDRPFQRTREHGPDDRQAELVRGGPCWECARQAAEPERAQSAPRGSQLRDKSRAYTNGRRDGRPFQPDHQPPLGVAWQTGGCHMPPGEFERWALSSSSVRPQCTAHAASQGGALVGSARAGEGRAAWEACEAFLWGPP
jgi:hypothetical protein